VSRKPSRRLPKLKLSDLLHRDPNNLQQARVFDELMGPSDRAAALVAAASLDLILEAQIKLTFNQELIKSEEDQIFNASAPLASFAAKVRFCYALGIYGPITRNDLLEISHIRNIFAHSPLPVTFKTPQIRRACKKLRSLSSYAEAGIVDSAKYDIRGADLRTVFFVTTLAIGSLILRRTSERLTTVARELKDVVQEFRRRRAAGQDMSGLSRRPLP
jgi:hypothetical protein